MLDMTEEEADALDEYFTKNLPRVDPTKGGVTTRQGFRMVALDRLSEDNEILDLFDNHKNDSVKEWDGEKRQRMPRT